MHDICEIVHWVTCTDDGTWFQDFTFFFGEGEGRKRDARIEENKSINFYNLKYIGTNITACDVVL